MGTVATPVQRFDGKENLPAKKKQKLKNISLEISFQSPRRARPFSLRNINSPGMENVSYASLPSSTTSVEPSPVVVRKRPLSKPVKNSDFTNVSYMSSEADSISSCRNSPRLKRSKRNSKNSSLKMLDSMLSESDGSEISIQPRNMLLRNARTRRESLNASYESSRAESLQSVDTTFASPKVILPLRARRQNQTLIDVSRDASIDDSLNDSVKIKKLFKTKKNNDENMDIFYESSVAETANETELNTPQSFNSDKLTPSQDSLKKKRPLSMAPLNHSIEGSLFMPSQDKNDSLESTPREESSSDIGSISSTKENLADKSTSSLSSNKLQKSEPLAEKSSLDDSLINSEKSSQKKRPLSVAPLNHSMLNASYMPSQDKNDSLESLPRELPFSKKSNENLDESFSKIAAQNSIMEKSGEDSFKSLRRSERLTEKSLQDDSLTESEKNIKKKRPLSVAPVNRSMLNASYAASQTLEDSSTDVARCLPLRKKSNSLEESTPSFRIEEIRGESFEALEDNSLRRSTRLVNKTLTPIQDSNLSQSQESSFRRPLKISSINKTMKETSYIASQENEQKSFQLNRRLMGKQGRTNEISFSGISYQESLMDSSTRSEAPPSESEPESEEESEEEIEDKTKSVEEKEPESEEETEEESEEEIEDKTKSVEEKEPEEECESVCADEPESVLADSIHDELRNVSITDRLTLHASVAEPEANLTFSPSESLKDDNLYSYSSPLTETVLPAAPTVQERVRLRIQAIMKEAEENVAKKFQPYLGCPPPQPIAKPQKRPANPDQDSKKVRGVLRPKLYKPARWANKRLYDYLSKKLQSQFGMRNMLKAEEVVKIIYETVQKVEKNENFQKQAVNRLKLELATLNIIETTDDFYQFIRSFMPKTCENKMIPCLQPFTNIVWPPKDDLKKEWEKILD